MCEHEDEFCPGRSCRCECMNCLYDPYEDEADYDISDPYDMEYDVP